MTGYVARRLLQMIPTLAGVVVLVFVLFDLVGGDPSYLLAGMVSDPQQIAAIRQQLGLDRPWPVRLGLFAQQALTLDFGRSWATGEPVGTLFATRLGPSLTVLLPLLLAETGLALLIALTVAMTRRSLTDRLLMIGCTIAMSVSLIVYILVGQYWLAFRLGWFPVQGWGDGFWHNLATYAPLPILLGLAVGLAPNVRLFRGFVLDEVDQDYVRTARAKGLSEWRTMFRHVLRNTLVPVITFVVTNLPALLIGAFLLERFFSIPGIGREIVLAVERSDFPVIKAATVYLALATMLFNLAGDLLYRVVDPRVRLR
ncbi:MAG TPA: ABC transporter permease [Burkholderiaceae bacterium]|nr:ABC transporter permease [Burkholderiaceae bacterium]